MLQGAGTGAISSDIDTEIVTPMHGGIAFILGCSTMVYDVTYEYVDGIVASFIIQMSNASLANTVQKPMIGVGTYLPYLQQAASIAAFKKSAQEFADKLAVAYSKVSLSLAAQSFDHEAATLAHHRDTRLVAKVLAAPLHIFVARNLLFVVAGVILVGVALATRTPASTQAQAQLNITGLIPHAFERRYDGVPVQGPEDLFDESDGHENVRIGISRTSVRKYVYRNYELSEHIQLRQISP